LSWQPCGSENCVWLCKWADNLNHSRSRTVSSRPSGASVFLAVQAGSDSLSAERNNSSSLCAHGNGSSRAAYCCTNVMHMICRSHIVAFTFRVIQTAIIDSSNIGQHKMLAGRMTLPLSQITFYWTPCYRHTSCKDKAWFFKVSSRQTTRYELQLGHDHCN